jgi:hypothetical protein
VRLDGADGLRKYLTDRRAEMAAHVSRKLLGYALGRAVRPGDADRLRRMESALAAGGGFATLVEAVVTSPQFRNVRVDAVNTVPDPRSRP